MYEFSDWKFTSTPAEEFTTEHYGLGNVKLEPVRKRRSHAWTLAFWGLIPVALAGISIVAYRRWFH